MTVTDNERAINNFREYLRIKSVHPEPDYESCVSFLVTLAEDVGLKTKVIHLDEKRPVVVMTWEGQLPELPSVLLNSHMDVVPVYKEEWKHDPFEAKMDEKGDIFARGAQDMKCVTIAQLEAIRNLITAGIKLNRTVHLSVLPDEEIGSATGMAKFVHTETFKKLNVGFDLDEGATSTDDEFLIFKNERCHWGLLIHCPGTTGHGSLLHPNTPGEKLRVVIDEFMDFRKRQGEKLVGPILNTGDITTINLTTLKGGVQNNVVPPEMIVGFDLRIATEDDHEAIEKWIMDVCKKAGDDVFVEYLQKDPKAPSTCFQSNPFSTALDTAVKSLNRKAIKLNCYGATDARFVRKFGIPALGFSPFLNTVRLLHGHNEYMNKDVFLEGISHYETIIPALANA